MSLQFLQPYFGLGNGLQTKNAGGGGGGVGGWVELGRTTLGSSSDTITVSSLANKRYYMLLQHNILSSSNCQQDLQFGSGGTPDTGSNYSTRQSDNGTEGTSTSQPKIYTRMTEVGTTPGLAVSYIANFSTKEKLILGHTIQQNTAGAGTAPFRGEWVGKWANTSNALNVIKAFGTAGGTMDANSELVVLGWDPADTHSNNFWTELVSVESGSAGDNLSSGTIAARKYLWVQAYLKNSGGAIYNRVSFNNDAAGGNYAFRRSFDGGADATGTSQNNIADVLASASYPHFVNMFIINVSAKEKLVIGHTVGQNTAGAGNAPLRTEFVAKWANTSAQITEIDMDNTGAGDFASGSILKVWGAD